jgi:hypothetical protein
MAQGLVTVHLSSEGFSVLLGGGHQVTQARTLDEVFELATPYHMEGK